MRALMEEAVNVNNSWLYQSYLKEKSEKLEEPNPFIEVEDQVAVSVGYVYKVWTLGKGRRVCIRCSIHNAVEKGN